MWELLQARYGLYGVLGALHSVLVPLSQAAVSNNGSVLLNGPCITYVHFSVIETTMESFM